MSPVARTNPIAGGSLLALAAAVLFGASAPLIKAFGAGTGPFATAAVLYAGAAIGAGSPRRRAAEARLRSTHAGRLALVAVFGAVLAPACLAWGLQQTGALVASLLLNLEAVFTVLLARAFYQEPVGARVGAACALMLTGGALLALQGVTPHEVGTTPHALRTLPGVLAIAAATAGWSLDNTLTRPLADLDPRAVVFWKALGGCVLSTVVALSLAERWPVGSAVVVLALCGAAGYGFSLRLYLRAQRVLGAARTGSLFAVGPFVGAALAFLLLGERGHAASIAAATACFVVAVALHVSERHAHVHRHGAVEHEHAHRHDDDHHHHRHEPAVVGSHSHRHTHEPLEHDHAHAADVHHRHDHS